jgi:glycosyltransferase involved in cell wall biosynthesis
MKVLILHNRYRQPGGEDQVARAEIRMLCAQGVDVYEYEVDNETVSPLESAWSRDSYEKVRDVCRRFRPDVAHVHNFWLKLTPSVHAACRESGAATVQTLHNFRLLCANGLFLRNSEVCEDCLGKSPWRGVLRRCYRDSFAASAGVARMIVLNRRRGTWDRDVDAFIVLSQAARERFEIAGFAPERLFLKANFCEDPGEMEDPPSASNMVLCAGRLSAEKGMNVLLQAWKGQVGRLVIAGDGPERAALERQASELDGVTFLGRVDAAAMSKLYRSARVVALPSICFEQFPRGVVESFAHGRPLVASDIGGLGELVEHDLTGRKFAVKDAGAMAAELRNLLTDPELADRLGRAARAAYLEKYTAQANFASLLRIYEAACEHRRGAHRLQPSEAVAESQQAGIR